MKFLSVILCVTWSLAGHEEPTVVLKDDTEIHARLLEISDKTVSVVADNNTRIIDADKVVRIKFQDSSHRRPNPSLSRVELVDGSIIFATAVAIDGQTVHLVSGNGAKMDIEARHVASVQLTQMTSSQLESEWNQIEAAESRAEDALVIKRDDHLDYVEGIVGDVTPSKIHFQSGDRSVEADRSRIAGILFYHAAAETKSAAACVMLTTDHSRYQVQQVVADTTALQVTLSCGASFEYESADLTEFDFSSGRMVYLSQLQPTTIDWQPLIDNPALIGYRRKLNRPRMNVSFTGDPLSLTFQAPDKLAATGRRKEFGQGIAVKGGTRLVYVLPADYVRLEGLIGFAPHASPDGQVQVSILGDGQALFQRVLNNRSSSPLELDLPIVDVSRLTIKVDYHDGRSVGDVLHFCDLKARK